MGGQCLIDSMGTKKFQNYCNYLLKLYKVYSLFSFPYLLILICIHNSKYFTYLSF